MIHITTTRFDSKTIEENHNWKKRKRWVGCIYGSDIRIPSTILLNTNLFVIEMVNDIENIDLGLTKTGKLKKGIISGIGYIKNRYKPENRSKIYEDHNYNRYVYKGKNHITRGQVIEKYGKEIIVFLEKMLFTGSRHFKRGHGFTSISHERIMIQNYLYENIKKPQICSTCGLPRLNHKCSGKLEKKNIVEVSKKLCPICNKKRQRGHICPSLKRDKDQLKKVLTFFRNLYHIS